MCKPWWDPGFLKEDLNEYLGEQLGKSEYLLYFIYHEGIIVHFSWECENRCYEGECSYF